MGAALVAELFGEPRRGAVDLGAEGFEFLRQVARPTLNIELVEAPTNGVANELRNRRVIGVARGEERLDSFERLLGNLNGRPHPLRWLGHGCAMRGI